MARILYGVGGQGMGHATRSATIIKELGKEHELVIVSGGRAFAYLSEKFPNVKKVHVLHHSQKNDRILSPETFASNLVSIPRYYRSFQRVSSIIRSFKPEMVLCDLELFTALAAKKSHLPLLSIDNQHILTKTRLGIHQQASGLALKFLIRSMAPRATDYIITTFFLPKRKALNVHLVPPIVRESIIRAKCSIGKHVLVYQTSKTHTTLLEELQKIDEQFIVYGYDRIGRQKNLIFRKFNEKQFFRDLASCKAIVTNGGLSLIGEAVYLKKPVFSMPIRDDFEQYVNAYHIQKKGYGLSRPVFTRRAFLHFMSRLDSYKAALREHRQDGNRLLLEKLRAWITLYAGDA
ncbi:MAG: MJ1255/VC2487 family glycosyltransferase [Nanoarchaeota archaeon]